MERTNNLSAWVEQGYILFADEGICGIQVERLARILQLNKSGFYHYFGNLDVFYRELLSLHKKKAGRFMNDLRCIKRIDPEYFEIVVRHKFSVMFQSQLIRATDQTTVRVAEMINIEEENILREAWSEFLGSNSPNLAIRYFSIVRDMCYARMSSRNISFVFLHDLMTEARMVMQGMTQNVSVSNYVGYLSDS